MCSYKYALYMPLKHDFSAFLEGGYPALKPVGESGENY